MCIVIIRAIKMSKMSFIFSRNNGPCGAGKHYVEECIRKHKRDFGGRSQKMVLCSGSNLESFLEEDMLFRLDLQGQAGFGEAETGQ